MKIRIRGNSLRLRLLRREVEHFAETGRVEEVVTFGHGPQLRYTLEAHDGPALAASFDGGCIRVLVPRATALHWARTEAEVSVLGEESTEAGTLKLLIEKDFACINPSSVWQEDQSDNFPNPYPSCGSHQ